MAPAVGPTKAATPKTTPPFTTTPKLVQKTLSSTEASSAEASAEDSEESTSTTCWDDLVYTLFALSVGLLAIMIALYIAKLQLDKKQPHIL